ncbi:unnamed protein product [Acanthoscelides obtectus]|uniref:Uncharacterized protein n=1 Tax=Acanthoscelides obtectus TaxID=200917 RepID=A0A9P0KD13_ACAOB|nr:unnamed protein product [Acanthoscelides obtectus]CAK1676502.1 hypothetical protein AOBTE_LOCUS30789 [Acanthoscelides obtectus]
MSEKRKRPDFSDSDSDDYIIWKIARLKKRLKKHHSKGRRSHRSPSPQSDVFTTPDHSDDDDVPLSAFAARNADAVDSEVAGSCITNTTPIEDGGSSILDASILALLGDEKPSADVLGPSIHVDLTSRWSFILSNGLSEASVNTLLKKYPPPENCPLLKCPRINPEVASAINEQVARRDSNLNGLQNQIGAALSALGQLASAVVSEEGGGDLAYVELASDASRLLLDFYHKYSVIRRDLLILNLRKDLKETLTNVSADGWLFGKDLGERIKATKDIEKSGLDLKPTRVSRPSTSFKQPAKQVPENFYRPPRRTQRGNIRGGRPIKIPNPSQSFQKRPHQTQRRTSDQDHRRRQDVRQYHKQNR